MNSDYGYLTNQTNDGYYEFIDLENGSCLLKHYTGNYICASYDLAKKLLEDLESRF